MCRVFLIFFTGFILSFSTQSYSQVSHVCPVGTLYNLNNNDCNDISPGLITFGSARFCIGDSIGFTTQSGLAIDSVWICWGDGATTVSDNNYLIPTYHNFDFPVDSCMCNGKNTADLDINVGFYSSCSGGYSYEVISRTVTLQFKPRPKFTTVPSCPFTNANIDIPSNCRDACANGSTSDTTYVVWDMGNGDQVNLYSINSTIPTPNYQYPTPGTYNVTLNLNNSMCGNASYTAPITILPNTIIDPLLASGPYCAPGDISVKEIDPTPQHNFSWTISPTLSGVVVTDSTLFAQVNSPGNYTVTINVSNGCCTAPTSICHWDSTITFGTAPILNQVINYNTSCDPVTVNFSNSFITTASDNHYWQIDSLSSGILYPVYSNNTANPTGVLLSNTATYIITAVSANLCASDTLRDTLQILGPTTFSPVLGSISNCAPDSIKVLSTGAINASGISWAATTLSGGTISPALTSSVLPVFQISAAGSYSISGLATGCCLSTGSDCSFNQQINIGQSPVVQQTLNYGDSCNSSTISFINNFNLSFADSVHWNIDSISGAVNFPFYYNTSNTPLDLSINTIGTYILTLTAYNDCALPNGISIRDTFSILPPTIISPSYTLPSPLCAPDSIIVLSANAQHATSLSWMSNTISGGNITPANSAAATPTFQISGEGSYQINLAATGCCTSPQSICSVTDTFNFKQSPILSQVNAIDDHCDSTANYTIKFSDYFNFQSLAGDLGYLWKITEQPSGNIIWSSSGSSLPNVPLTSYGSYLITASAWNDCDSIVISDNFNLTAPSPLVLRNDTIVCKNSADFFLAASPAGGAWTLNGTAINNGIFSPENINQSYNYCVYTVGTNECLLKDSILIIVSGAEVNAGIDKFYCDNESIDTLIGNPVGSNGIWSGTGVIDSILGIINPDSINNSPSLIVYTVTDSICTTKDTVSITVFDSPTAQPLWPDTACVGESIQLINPSLLFTATWEFGDGSSAITGDTINKTYLTSGNYVLEVLLITPQNCNQTFTHPIFIAEPPVAGFTVLPDTICFGDSVLIHNLNPDNIFTQYYWTYGINLFDTIYNPGYLPWTEVADSILHVPISVTAKNGCGSDTASDTFFVKPFPKAHFDVHQNSGCSPDTIYCSNVSTGNPQSFTWYIDNVFLSGDSTLSPLVLTADSIDKHYYITLIVKNECAIDTLTREVIVGPPKPVPFFNLDPAAGCVPLTITLTSSVQANSIISWNFGDGNVGLGDTVTHTFFTPGNYEVTQYAAGCGVDSLKQYVNAFTTPPVSFSVSAVNCINAPVTYTITSPGLIGYDWDFGDGSPLISGVENPSHQYNAPGIYTTTLTGYGVPSSPGISCVNTFPFPIAVVDKPLAKINLTDNSDCFPFTLELSAINLSERANRYDWFFGNGDTIRGNLIQNYVYQNPGSFALTLIAYDNNKCSDTTHFNYINVFPEIKPEANFEADSTDQEIFNPEVRLINLSRNAYFYEWDLGNNTKSNLFEPYCIYKDIGQYPITLTVENNFGCRDSVIHTVIIRPSLSLYVPNAFTPGGKNPVFKPELSTEYVVNYEFRIYSRWGKLFFLTNDPEKGWDGTFNGSDCPEGVYIYEVKGKRIPFDRERDAEYKNGTFTLLR